VDAFFVFAVSDLKLPRLRTMLRMFHDLFKHDGACTVWGFRKVTETSTSSTRTSKQRTSRANAYASVLSIVSLLSLAGRL
jgi:hypothetical protein